MQRRTFLQSAMAAGVATPLLGTAAFQGTTILPAAEPQPTSAALGRAEHCIMIWLGGGMAQIDSFDPKAMGDAKSRKAGSYYRAIDTVVPGVQVCEHLTETGKLMDRITALRTVHHDVVDEHAAATNRMHTGRPTSGTVQYPSIGSVVAQQRGAVDERVPAYLLIGYPNLTRGPGFLGQQAGYVYLTDVASGPAGLARPASINAQRQARRQNLLREVRAAGRGRFADDSFYRDYDTAIAASLRLAGPEFMEVFDLNTESDVLRNSYGKGFGQRMLLSRRLCEAGVRFVEVSHNMNFRNGTGWDTHNDGQLKQHLLIKELDIALAALLQDLETRAMLDKTLIVINTEFGRPADFDSGGGRGHHATCFTTVLAGGGLSHCGAYGTTDERAMQVAEHPVSVPDMFATIYAAMQIDPHQNLFDGDRPVPITDRGKAIRQLLS